MQQSKVWKQKFSLNMQICKAWLSSSTTGKCIENIAIGSTTWVAMALFVTHVAALGTAVSKYELSDYCNWMPKRGATAIYWAAEYPGKKVTCWLWLTFDEKDKIALQVKKLNKEKQIVELFNWLQPTQSNTNISSGIPLAKNK